LDFYLTTRDLESKPWTGPWRSWPYRAMRFYLALKREEARCELEEQKERQAENNG
jgi:hypothetical protein